MKKVIQSYWKKKPSKVPIWKQKNDDNKLGNKKIINFEQTKGKRLIGHSSNEDYYEDTEGNTFIFKGNPEHHPNWESERAHEKGLGHRYAGD